MRAVDQHEIIPGGPHLQRITAVDGCHGEGTGDPDCVLEARVGVGRAARVEQDEQAVDGEEATTKVKPAAPAKEDSNGKINNSSTASLTAKVMAQTEQSKKRKMDNENVKSLFSNRDQTAALGNSAGFMTRGFSHVKRRTEQVAVIRSSRSGASESAPGLENTLWRYYYTKAVYAYK